MLSQNVGYFVVSQNYISSYNMFTYWKQNYSPSLLKEKWMYTVTIVFC